MSGPSSRASSVYAVAGKDHFLRNQALERILRTLASQMDALGPTRLDGAVASPSDFLDELRTPSLLGGRRVVIVDDADDCIREYRDKLEKYCADPASGSVLILVCDSLPKTTRLRRIISQRGEIIDCEPPRPSVLAGWIVRRAKDAYGKTMHPAAARTLKEHVGDALGALDVELAKLASFVNDRSEITRQDIDAATGEHREEKVFAVMNAVIDGDTGLALKMWEQVLATDRAAPDRAIGGLAWGVRRWLDVRRDWERGADLDSLARRMFTDPETLRRRLEQTGADQLQAQQRDLLAADLAIKTGLATVQVAVERFIVKFGTRVAVTRSKAG